MQSCLPRLERAARGKETPVFRRHRLDPFRYSIGLRSTLFFTALFLLCSLPAHAAKAPYFTLSTEKTFAPGTKPSIHLYTRNESELEFRVYKVRDEEKFLSSLAEMHSFGASEQSSDAAEDIDEETWLERFHDWKASLRSSVRDFFRGQLSVTTRDALRDRQASAVHRSRIVGVAQFAQIPLLNDRQLVARWRQEVPPTFVSNSQKLPIDPLPGGMYLIEATDGHLKAYTLLMVSETALITRTVAGQVLAFVVDRKSGQPVANAKVTLALNQELPAHMTTGSDGTATFNAPAAKAKASGGDQAAGEDDGSNSDNDKQWVLARSGDNVAVVAPWSSAFRAATTDTYTAYTYTDRPVYRPGHTVHFKSVLRLRAGDALKLPVLKQVHVTVTDADSKTLLDKQLPVSAFGTVEDSLTLPANASLGDDTITLEGSADENVGTGSFLVEDYRKPEYQVRVSVAKPRVLQGEDNTATIEARYFFGEPVAGAKVKYRVYESPHYWWGDPEDSDDNAPGFSAAGPSPTDSADASEGNGENDGSDPGNQNEEKTGTLGADGKLTVQIPTRFGPKDQTDKDMVVEGAVTDPAGREITGRYRFLATYGSFRIHVESPSYFLHQHDAAEFDLTAIDYDNRPVRTSIHVHVYQRKPWSGEPDPSTDTPVADTDATTDATGKATVHLPIHTAGSLLVLATANTPEQRTVQDDSWLFVNGSGDAASGLDIQTSRSSATLIADKKTYAPGDTAHLTLISQATGVSGFHALILATGYQQEFRKVVTACGSSVTFDVPITRDSQPNLMVEALFIKDEMEYVARKSLNVPPTQQQLQVTVTPTQGTFTPGQAALYDVTAKDFAGHPVSADLSFGVVDEAIYTLHPDYSGDMVRAFYPKREVSADVEDSLTYYFTGEAGTRNPLLAERHSRFRPQLAQVKPGNNVVQPKIRKDFPDTAYWQPSIHTDANGHARVSLNFPDSLTTWRATVRADTLTSEFGSTVNRVLVRKNIIVRMGQPRFLRKGDTATVPVIVHNYLADSKEITLSLEASGVTVVNPAAQRVTVAPHGEATVLYRLRADAIGTATLTAKALSTQESDALQLTVPVQPNGVQEILPDSGVLYNAADGAKTIVFPANTDPAAHSLTVTVSPTIAGSLFSSLDYLTSFPYGCTEQTMSSFLPNVIVGEAMSKLGIPPRGDPALFKQRLDAKVQAGLERLTDYHHEDGGWGWWKEDTSQVFMTAYVVSGLAQAAHNGYPGAAAVLHGGPDFLTRALADHPRMEPELRAYVVYALAEAGSNDPKQLDALFSRRNDLSAQALAYTGLAMLDRHDSRATDIAHQLEAKALVSGDLASWPAARNELLDIDSDDSAASTAFALKFLVHADPGSGLIPRAAQWLAAHRTEGLWWGSTQQTAFVLYGLTDYLAATHEFDADLDVTVLLNNTTAAHQHFAHADVVQGSALTLQFDATKLQPQANTVRIVTRGTGRAYWSTQGAFFSTDKHAFQRGNLQLNIARDYFSLVPVTDAQNHITYNLQPLAGSVNIGDVLAVHLGVTGTPQKYLLLEDPIHAGVEFVTNTGSYKINHAPAAWDFWYTRQEFHDDRAAIFATTFSGRHDSFYLVRVTNCRELQHLARARAAHVPARHPGHHR